MMTKHYWLMQKKNIMCVKDKRSSFQDFLTGITINPTFLRSMWG
ncbi:hypothetical protein Barb4_00316 [Bacteroidales bacterium Barb4]|nr:hypothetical protein Barb4_00316 [Bacteroidales bacterium Barb4]